MHECSKATRRRVKDVNFTKRYLVGDGIDIGGGDDHIGLQLSAFPLMRNIRVWDMVDGNAQFMEGIEDHTYDFVHSSHCLEHMHDPIIALCNWYRILKPGGHMIIMVPDEDIYEQGIYPSTFNPDHKSTFTISKKHSWTTCSYNIFDLLDELDESAEIKKIELLDQHFEYGISRIDQTLGDSESSIEFVVRKRLHGETVRGGRLPLNVV